MRLGIMSDTHGNIGTMQSVADRMLHEFHVDSIIHLGDDMKDTELLNTDGKKLYAVPGMYEDAWNDKNVQHRMIKEFDGVTFLISHTSTRDSHDRKGDMNPERARSKFKADVLLHGHTHRHRAVESADDGLIVINPGHLKDAHDRNSPASFAIIDVNKGNLSVKFIGLDNTLLGEEFFDLKEASIRNE
ncbi:MAG: YfcE family phosphodiesterase [Deltaproteobacteria bacterium]|jgi:putative phosphoesterase|nr:YfcE family phosphodiesterase [Deltaproteobacteria bacterium]